MAIQDLSVTLLKPMDAAKILNISRSTIYQLLQSGDIPVVRIKSSVRIRPIDLNAYIEQNRNSRVLQLSLF